MTNNVIAVMGYPKKPNEHRFDSTKSLSDSKYTTNKK